MMMMMMMMINVVTVFVNGRYLGGFIFALYLVSVYGAMCLAVVDIYFHGFMRR